MKPSEHAERATLGAILHDPARLDEIADQLTSSDFWRPYHQAVWAAMLRLREQGKKVTAETVKDELPNRPEVAAHLARNAIPLVDLMEATPRAGTARSYAAMVAEASMHRRVDTLGEHLFHVASNGTAADMAAEARSGRETLAYAAHQHASLFSSREEEGTYGTDGKDSTHEQEQDRAEQMARTRAQLETVRSETRQAAEDGDRQAGRLASLTDAVLGILDNTANWSIDAPTPPARGGREFIVPDRNQPGAAAPAARQEPAQRSADQEHEPAPDPGRAELEDRLLSSLTTEPAQLDKMGDLDPSMFTAPGRQRLFEALSRTHHAQQGEAAGADELTVLWEAQRAGTLDEITAEDAQAALSDGLPGVAATTAAELGQEAAKDDTRSRAHALRAAAADPTQHPGQLVSDTTRSLDELAHRCEAHERAGADRQHQLDLNHDAEQHQGERDEVAQRRADREQQPKHDGAERASESLPRSAEEEQKQAPDREQQEAEVGADNTHDREPQQEQEQEAPTHAAETNQPDHAQEQPRQRRRSEVPDEQRTAELQQVWEQRWPVSYRAPERDDDTQDAEGKAPAQRDSDERPYSAQIADRFIEQQKGDQLHTAMTAVRARAQTRRETPDGDDQPRRREPEASRQGTQPELGGAS